MHFIGALPQNIGLWVHLDVNIQGHSHFTSRLGAYNPSLVQNCSAMMMSSNRNIFSRNWPFVREIHWSPVDSSHKDQWRGAPMFSLIYAWTNGWANNRNAGDLRRHRNHYDVTVMYHWFLTATRQLYEWLSPSVRPYLRPSVCLWHIFHYVPVIVSSWNYYQWQKWCPCKRSWSKVKVTEVTTQLNRFRTVTPVWIHKWWWNDA